MPSILCRVRIWEKESIALLIACRLEKNDILFFSPVYRVRPKRDL